MAHLGSFLANIQMERIGTTLQRNWTREVDEIKDTDVLCLLLVEVASALMLPDSILGPEEYRSVVELGRKLAERIPSDIKHISAGRRVAVNPDMFFRL